MTDPPDPQHDVTLSAQDVAAGESYAATHDPGAGEDYAGEPVPDPWEVEPDGQLDSGAVPGVTP